MAEQDDFNSRIQSILYAQAAGIVAFSAEFFHDRSIMSAKA